MENNIKIWERQPDEPEDIYKIFEAYLSQVQTRTHNYIAAITGKSLRTIERLSSKWNWTKRTDAYDMFVRNNHKAGLIEFCEELEIQKFFLKMSFAMVSKEVYHNLKVWMEYAGTACSNPEIYKQLKFYKEVASTAKKVYSLIDFEPHPEIIIEKFKRDVQNNNRQSQVPECAPMFDSTAFQNFRHFFDYFSQIVKDKNENLYDNTAIERLNSPKVNNNKELETDVLSVIYSDPNPGDDNSRQEYYHRCSKS